MARLARIVLPNVPHHVTQRGNGRVQTFFGDDDYLYYRSLFANHCQNHGIRILGWCLMPNHVHLILTPPSKDALRGAMSRLHRQYAGHVHAREHRTGHFWQGRFGCVAMDDDHLIAAMAYVALNPVRARLVGKAEDWPWSSARAYRRPKTGDGIIDLEAAEPYLKAVKEIIRAGEEDVRFNALRRAETIGRPIGSGAFMKHAEAISGRSLKPAKRGPKPKRSN